MALRFDKISMWMRTNVWLATEPPSSMRYPAKFGVPDRLTSQTNGFCVPMIEVDRKEEFSLVCFC